MNAGRRLRPVGDRNGILHLCEKCHIERIRPGAPCREQSQRQMRYFDLNEEWPLIASDEAELGGRETRGMTIRELAVLQLMNVRSN